MNASVAIVDHDLSFLQFFVLAIEVYSQHRCVGAFASGPRAVKELPALAPNVVLLDVFIPEMSGIECLAQVLQRLPQTLVISVTSLSCPEKVLEVMNSGAGGHLQKPFTPPECINAIDKVLAGKYPLSDLAATALVEDWRRRNPQNPCPSLLSRREVEVMALLELGLSDKAMAEKLGVSVETIHNHVRHILGKLSVHSRGEAVARYRGILPAASPIGSP